MSKTKFNPDKPFTLSSGESCRILVKNQKDSYDAKYHIAICEEDTPQAKIIHIYDNGAVNMTDIDWSSDCELTCKNTPEVSYLYQLTSKYNDSFNYSSAKELTDNWYSAARIRLITETRLENDIPVTTKLVTLEELNKINSCCDKGD